MITGNDQISILPVTSSDIYNEQFWNQKDIPPPKKGNFALFSVTE